MSTASLEKRLALPREMTLSTETWLAAAVLGRLRTVVNDQHRAKDRDRGRLKNVLNDLQGALGELVGLELLHGAGLATPTVGLLDLKDSVDKADLVAATHPPVLLEVKCHLDEPQKRLFLVNERARTRSISRGVQVILPVVAAALCSIAYVGKLIPISELATWKLGKLGSHTDPARQLPLRTLHEKHLGRIVRSADEGYDARWGSRQLAETSLLDLNNIINASTVDRHRREGFSLDGLFIVQVRNALLAQLPPGFVDAVT